jgi:hypothetical protein
LPEVGGDLNRQLFHQALPSSMRPLTSSPYRGHLYLSAKKKNDNVDRGALKAFNTVKEDLDEEEEYKENDDEIINKRRRE